MFFQTVKFLLPCIFLENESIFHFFFFFFLKGHSVPTARLSLDEHPLHTTLKQTYFHTLCKWEPGSFEPILGEQGNETIYAIVLPFFFLKQGLENPYNFYLHSISGNLT